MRPPRESWEAMMSIARAILGRAFAIARGTLLSSRLMRRAIASALMVSSEAAARLRRSVPSCWIGNFLFAIFHWLLVIGHGSIAVDRFDHGIVEARPQFFDRLVLAVGPSAIRQQRNRELALG